MSVSCSFWGYSIMVAFLTGATAAAQSPRYHLEYVSHGGGQIVLVNDSSSTIEAVRLVHECSLSRMSMSTDVLDSPEYSSMIRDAAGNPAQSVGPEQGGTWELEVFDNSERSKYVGECAPRVDFILFGDGSYEGKESEVRVLKATRDGEFASIIEWLEIFNRQDADRVDVTGLLELAGRREVTAVTWVKNTQTNTRVQVMKSLH